MSNTTFIYKQVEVEILKEFCFEGRCFFIVDADQFESYLLLTDTGIKVAEIRLVGSVEIATKSAIKFLSCMSNLNINLNV
jgi:hypothetical protein